MNRIIPIILMLILMSSAAFAELSISLDFGSSHNCRATHAPWESTIYDKHGHSLYTSRHGGSFHLRLLDRNDKCVRIGDRVRVVPFARKDGKIFAELKLIDFNMRQAGTVKYLDYQQTEHRPIYTPRPRVHYQPPHRPRTQRPVYRPPAHKPRVEVHRPRVEVHKPRIEVHRPRAETRRPRYQTPKQPRFFNTPLPGRGYRSEERSPTFGSHSGGCKCGKCPTTGNTKRWTGPRATERHQPSTGKWEGRPHNPNRGGHRGRK